MAPTASTDPAPRHWKRASHRIASLTLAVASACGPEDTDAAAGLAQPGLLVGASPVIQVDDWKDPTDELDRELSKFFCRRYNLRAPQFLGAVPLREMMRDFGTEGQREFATQPDVAATLGSILGIVCAETGQYGTAELLLRTAIGYQEKSIGGYARATLRSQVVLARILQTGGRSDEVRRAMSDMTTDVRGNLGEQDPIRLDLAVLRMRLEFENARLASDIDHRAWLLISKVQSAPDVGAHTRSLAYGNLAQALSGSGRIDEGLRAAEKAVADATEALGPLHPVTLDLRVTRGRILHDAGRNGEAADELDHALALQESRLGRLHPSRIRGLRAAIRARALSGRSEPAAAAARELLEVLAAQPRLDITLNTAATSEANEILSAHAGGKPSGG